MALSIRRTPPKTFEKALDTLREHGFEVTEEKQGRWLVSKNGSAAVLAAAKDPLTGSPAVYAERPGLLVRGEIATILDRGYQKFIKTSQYELPATAQQLQALHAFSEELTERFGGISLYNESLGTTSDEYEYDRLKGRPDQAAPAAGRPWDQTEGH